MTTTPLAYFWGDDDFAWVARSTGSPRRSPRRAARRSSAGTCAASATASDALLGQLRERIATPVMFGGGTLVVVSNVGALMVSNDGRDAVLGAVATLAPGNALVILDATKSGREGPVAASPSPRRSPRRSGDVREFPSPKAGQPGRLDHARGRTSAASSSSRARPRSSPTRVGGFVQQNDVERPFQTRTASSELDKLALYRGASADHRRRRPGARRRGRPGLGLGLRRRRRRARRRARPLALLEDLLEATPGAGPARRPPSADPRAARDRRPRRERREPPGRRARRWASRASSGSGRSLGRPVAGRRPS